MFKLIKLLLLFAVWGVAIYFWHANAGFYYWNLSFNCFILEDGFSGSFFSALLLLLLLLLYVIYKCNEIILIILLFFFASHPLCFVYEHNYTTVSHITKYKD